MNLFNLYLVPFGLLLLSFSIMFISFFLFNDFQNRNIRYSKKTSGKIIDIKKVGDENDPDSCEYYPVYRFMANGDKETIAELPKKLDFQPILNKPEWIYYNSDNPQEFMPENIILKEKRFPQIVFLSSVILALFSIFIFILLMIV